MISRKDIYGGEATELLRVMAEYKALQYEQVMLLFPGREERINNLFTNLRRQGRLWQSEDGKIIKVLEEVEINKGIVKAFWVLLDFIDFTEYHCSGSFPITLCFFLHAEFYEVIYIPQEQETLMQSILREQEKEPSKRIVIVDDSEQIDRLDIPGASGYCTVSDKGEILYYQKNEEVDVS